MEKVTLSSAIPQPLTFYRGGLNVGTFYPGPPITPSGSVVLGNQFTGDSRVYRASGTGQGARGVGWALIISPQDIRNFSFRNKNEPLTIKDNSLYDGDYNKSRLNSSEKSKLSRYIPNSYTDWYVPSRDELAFIAQNLPKNFELSLRFSPMRDQYLTSTYISQDVLKNSPRKFSLLYSQSFSEPTYGNTIVVSDTKPMTVRLVRRVPVYII